ncbi:DUF2061 domain-containing protein [Thalassobaculum salexigens]|uniref:DUF2061 domain-containing protein n=1 Tax=Thalassobaculum salexigens TaxID=455360 RepID=UPI0004103D06|nr:DUF2061 domain-containing protein [Thalassobaculum salexigens]
MTMRIVPLLAGLCLGAAALFPAPASAIAVGDTVSDVLRVSGKDIPLPAGPHTVVEVGFAQIAQPEYGAQVNPEDYGPIRRITLVRADDGLIADAVEIVVNTLPHPDGWGIASDCARDDIYATLTRYKSGWDVSCMWVLPAASTALGEAVRPVDDAVMTYAVGQELVVPPLFLEAGFRVANRYDAVNVRYQFAAMDQGAPAAGTALEAWLPANIAEAPGPLAKVQSVAAWASSIYPAVEQGLRMPLAQGASFANPFDDVTFTGKVTDRAQRLAQLEVLRESGTVSPEEYARQKAIIEAEIEPKAENAWTYATVAGYKAFTYRVVVTTINAGIDYVFIGQPFAAGVLVILQVVVNTTKFFFHEVMWQELFGVGPLQRENPRVMDFVPPRAA